MLRYKKVLKLECKQPNCSICRNPYYCDYCYPGYYLKSNGECTDSCPLRTYRANYKCEDCPINCPSCTNNYECTSCDNNYFLQIYECVPQCDDGYYQYEKKCERNINFILECDFKCLSCIDRDRCLICKNNYYLKEEKCIEKSECRNGWIIIGNYCKRCWNYDDCDECSPYDITICIRCKNNLKLSSDGRKCSNYCELNSYFSVSTNRCECIKVLILDCFANCESCGNYETCDTCKENYYLSIDRKYCRKSCLNGERADGRECKACKITGCRVCNTDINCCDECLSNKLLTNNTCRGCKDYCDKGTYPDGRYCKGINL